MIVMYSIVWVLVIVGMLYALTPSHDMRHQPGDDFAYYATWGVSIIILLVLHYSIMAHAGHTQLAIVQDVLGIGSYGMARLVTFLIRRKSGGSNERRICDDGGDRPWSPRVSGLCPTTPGADVDAPRHG